MPEIVWGTAADALRAVILLIPDGQLNGIIEDLKDEDTPREIIDLIRQTKENG
jgi:hypothetical protein